MPILVCFISTVNGHRKKKKKKPWKTGASSGHLTNLKQSILDFRYLWKQHSTWQLNKFDWVLLKDAMPNAIVLSVIILIVVVQSPDSSLEELWQKSLKFSRNPKHFWLFTHHSTFTNWLHYFRHNDSTFDPEYQCKECQYAKCHYSDCLLCWSWWNIWQVAWKNSNNNPYNGIFWLWCYSIQHKGIQHNDTQHKNEIYYAELSLCQVSLWPLSLNSVSWCPLQVVACKKFENNPYNCILDYGIITLSLMTFHIAIYYACMCVAIQYMMLSKVVRWVSLCWLSWRSSWQIILKNL